MILFGKGRQERIIDGGTFNCPHCRAPRDYVRKARHNRFFVFGVALFSLGTEPDLIECVLCGQGYNVDALAFKPSGLHPGAAKLLAGVKNKLIKQYPADYIRQDLIDQGVPPEVADSALEIAQKEIESDG